MADYQLTETDSSVIRTADGAWIPNNPANSDWIAYQNWLADGGVPDPYVEPPPLPPYDDPLAEAQRANARLDAGIQAAVGTSTRLGKTTRVAADPTDPVTQEQLAALQAQVDGLQEAVTAMLQAQATDVARV